MVLKEVLWGKCLISYNSVHIQRKKSSSNIKLALRKTGQNEKSGYKQVEREIEENH